MMTEQWDVAVIGGGPAGSSAAIRLAERGLKVVLFEALTFPHDKLCGEFLSPECAVFLDRLGMGERIQNLQPVSIQNVTMTTPDEVAWDAALPGTALGLSRKLLDAALAERAEQAGVKLRQSARVSGLRGNLAEGFELEISQPAHRQSISARAVIAAHGKRGVLDRVLGRPFIQQRQPFVAIKAHFRGPRIPGRIELHAFPGGYCGLSEIEGDARVVCLLASEQVFQKYGGKGPEALDHFINWMKGQNIYLRSWLQWATRIHERWISIAQVPFDPKPVMAGDVLMAGDSAGLIVPLAGNGISMALEGGLLAADFLARNISGEISAAELRRLYPQAWRKRFSGRLKLGRALQPILLHPHAAALTLRLLNTFPGLGRFLIAHTRGTNSAPAGNKTNQPAMGEITRKPNE